MLASSRSVVLRPTQSALHKMRQRNPLVESGLAMAGANWRSPGSATETGILTAEEIVGADLSGCQLITLSACDTGRGKQVNKAPARKGRRIGGKAAARRSAAARSASARKAAATRKRRAKSGKKSG